TLFIGFEVEHALKLQAFDLLKSFAGNALEVAVHADGGVHDAVDLFLAFGPLAGDGFLFAVEIVSHRRKSFDNRLNPLTKARAGEIAVDPFNLGLLSFGRLARAGDFDQRLTQRHGDGQGDLGIGDPDAIEKAERLNVFWQ